MMRKIVLLLFVALLAPFAAADAETFGVSAGLNISNDTLCFVTAPANASYHSTNFTVKYKGVSANALSWLALWQQNNSSGPWGAWGVVANQSLPANGTNYSYVHPVTGNVAYEIRFYCEVMSAAAASNVSENSTFFVDSIPPDITWVFPAEDNSSFGSYGENWTINISVTDRNLQYCNLTVDDSTGALVHFNCTYPVVISGNETCLWTDTIQTVFFDIGNWSFNVYAIDNASNDVNETILALLYPQNTSHSVWSLSDDPGRMRDWVLTYGMPQTITAFYHTPNYTENITGATCTFTSSQQGYDHVAMTEQGNGIYTFSYTESQPDYTTVYYAATCNKSGYDTKTDPGLYHTGNWHTPEDFISMHTYENPSYFDSTYNATDEVCVPLTVEGHDIFPDDTVELWAHVGDETAAGSCVTIPSGQVYPEAGNWTSSLGVTGGRVEADWINDTHFAITRDFPQSRLYIKWWNGTTVNSYSTNSFSQIDVDGIYCRSNDFCYLLEENRLGGLGHYVYSIKKIFLSNGTMTTVGSYNTATRDLECIGLAKYGDRWWSMCSPHAIYSPKNLTLFNNDATLSLVTITDTAISASEFWDSGDSNYFYTIIHSGPPRVGVVTVFSKVNGSNVSSFVLNASYPVRNPEGFWIKGDRAQLYLYYDSMSGIHPYFNLSTLAYIGAGGPSCSANLNLHNSVEGLRGDLLASCVIDKSNGWQNCTGTVNPLAVAETLYRDCPLFLCIDDASGISTRSEGAASYVALDWSPVDELGITMQSAWRLENTSCAEPDGIFSTRKYLVTTEDELISTDFEHKAVFVFGQLGYPWEYTHSSVDFENNVFARIRNYNTGECRVLRYTYFGVVTSNSSVDCNNTLSGVHKVHEYFVSFGLGGYYRGSTVGNLKRVGDYRENWGCTDSQILYTSGGNAYIVCVDQTTNFELNWLAIFYQFPPQADLIAAANPSAMIWAFFDYQGIDESVVMDGHLAKLWAHEYGTLTNIQTMMFGDNINTGATVMYHDLAGFGDTQVLQWSNDDYDWGGGYTLSGTDWKYGTLGYLGNWVFASTSEAEGSLMELDRASGATRTITNPRFNDLIQVSMFSPGTLSYTVYKDDVNLKLSSGQLCESCQDGDLTLNEVLTGLQVEKVWDKEKQQWTSSIVPGMSVKVYVDDVYKHAFDMEYLGIYMRNTADKSIILDGSKLTLKFYSYNSLQSTLDYEISLGQILMPPHYEMFEHVRNGRYWPNPWYYNGYMYVIPYLNNNGADGSARNPVKEDLFAADPGLFCNSYYIQPSGAMVVTSDVTMVKLGSYYAIKSPATPWWHTGEERSWKIICWNGSYYEMNESSVSMRFTNQTFGVTVNEWDAFDNQGSFERLNIYGANETIQYDFCVDKHPLHNYISSIPTGAKIDAMIGDPTGYTLDPNWVELSRASYSDAQACFVGGVSYDSHDSAEAWTDYLTEYNIEFPTHNHSMLAEVVWESGDIVPKNCRIYDMTLELVDNRQHELTTYFNCRGGARRMLWEFIVDNNMKYTDMALWHTPDLLQLPSTKKYKVFVYPPEEQEIYSFDCGDCLKLQKSVGSTVILDVRNAFLDSNQAEIPDTDYSETFQIVVGEETNEGVEVGAFWGLGGFSGIAEFALRNPFGFLLVILCIVIAAPIAVALLRRG